MLCTVQESYVIIMHRCNYKESKLLQNSVYVGALTMIWGKLFHSLLTEGKKENLNCLF